VLAIYSFSKRKKIHADLKLEIKKPASKFFFLLLAFIYIWFVLEDDDAPRSILFILTIANDERKNVENRKKRLNKILFFSLWCKSREKKIQGKLFLLV
jgi:hypothetical protein